MTSYEEFVEAYKKMIKYWADISTASGRACKLSGTFPDIMMSAWTDHCIKRGQVCSLGGAEHKDSSMYIVPVGVQDVANALYVIKYGIFGEDPICTPQEMLDAMRANWEGYEELHAKVLAMPKYGNDIPEVDDLLSDVYDWVKEIWHAQPATDGGTYEVSHTPSVSMVVLVLRLELFPVAVKLELPLQMVLFPPYKEPIQMVQQLSLSRQVA